MEVKSCERCGVPLGEVIKTKRYCKECAILVKKENQAARRAPYGVVPWHGKNKRKGIEMKALIEIILMWSAALAVVLAAFLLNLWLVHLVELLVGAKGTWGIIVAAAVMATGWILSFGSKKENK